MSDLFDKSIRTLELPRVLELLSEQAVSAEAKQRALRLRPETEPEEVLRLLDQTDAARNLIGLRGSPSFSGVKPVAEALDRADRGGALNTRELLTIADLLTAARRAKEYFNDEAAEKTAIDHLFLSLHGNRFLEEKIKRAIPDEDTIADAASTELADIRRHMRAAQAKSRQILQKIISSPSYGKILQETIITQRDGRFVVPVKAEHKGDLPGLVHDISSTGATLFVEPMGVVQANNEYIELQAKEQKEIDRILADAAAQAEAAADKFRTQAEAEDRDLLAKSERTAAEREERLVSAAQMEARKTLLTAKQEMVERAYQRALEKLRSLPQEQYVELLAALLARASSTGREEVVFSTEDREGAGKAAVARANELLAKEAAPELPLGDGVVANLLNKVAAGVSAFAQGTAMLAVSEETRDISGGFILKDGRIEVNCTFDALVRAEREQTAGEVAKLLFPEA